MQLLTLISFTVYLKCYIVFYVNTFKSVILFFEVIKLSSRSLGDDKAAIFQSHFKLNKLTSFNSFNGGVLSEITD